MSAISRVFLLLAAFMAVAGAIYGFTSHERVGSTTLLVGALTFAYLGLVSRSAARRAESEEPAQEEVHVGPTIWPFGFAVTAVILVLGLIVNAWILIAGAIAFALSASGWLREVGKSRAHADHQT